jgi:hypothetical protein
MWTNVSRDESYDPLYISSYVREVAKKEMTGLGSTEGSKRRANLCIDGLDDLEQQIGCKGPENGRR